MEEVESPIEHLQDELQEMAMHAKANWLKWSAMMSALFAVLTAISGLQSEHAAGKAMFNQIAASNQWNYYQAKGIKAMITEQQSGDDAKAKAQKYHEEQQSIKQEAEALSQDSVDALEKHEILSRAVTMFQVAIAITAIAVMTQRRGFLLFSLMLGCFGAAFLLQGLMA